MVGQHLPDRCACLVCTAKVPERRHKCRLRGKPARLFYQYTRGDVACRDEITEMKPRPRLVDSRFSAVERTEPLRLFFIVGGFAEIAGVAVKHACHMIDAGAAGGGSNRLLACSHGIVVATLKQARIAERYVSPIAVRVD